MPNPQRPMLTARSAGDPVPDLTSMVVIHRAIRADLSRLTKLAGPISDRAAPPLQAEAACRYTRQLLAAIRAHLGEEEGLIWPLIAATALQAVDLTLLTDDHRAIEAASHRTSHELACFARGTGLARDRVARNSRRAERTGGRAHRRRGVAAVPGYSPVAAR